MASHGELCSRPDVSWPARRGPALDRQRFDPAGRHADDAIGVGDQVEVVRHHDDSQPVVAVQVAEQLDDLAAGVGVEVAGRLVGEQDARPVDQGPGDGGPLHLAAGQLARLVLEPVAQADALEQLGGRGGAARGAAAASSSTEWPIICRHQHVLERRRAPAAGGRTGR